MLQSEISASSNDSWQAVLDSIAAAEHAVEVAFSGQDTEDMKKISESSKGGGTDAAK